MRAARPIRMLAILLAAAAAQAQAGTPRGIGVLGDSYSDEYQFYAPDRAAARNWVEILAQTRGLNFGEFDARGRAEPRNQGYAYNWARSDANTDDLIRTGQHTGLAEQVARGEVEIAVVFIGGNDFIHAMKTPDPAADLAERFPRSLANYRTAVRTLLDASPAARLVLVTVPDIRNLPEFAGPIREGRIPAHLADRFTRAIRQFNAQVRAFAAEGPRVAIIDLDLMTRAATLVSLETVLVAGRKLDRLGYGNDLDHFFLADVRHPGTLGQSLLAKLVVETINARFGAGVAPLDDREVLELAASVLTRSAPAASQLARLDAPPAETGGGGNP